MKKLLFIISIVLVHTPPVLATEVDCELGFFRTAVRIHDLFLLRHTYSKARAFGKSVHVGQMYGSRPFKEHLASTDAVAVRFGYGLLSKDDIVVRSAIWLHDAREDSGVKDSEIRAIFGDDIADVVDAVTLPEGLAREAAFEHVFARLREVPTAVPVKLADRIDNVERAIFELFDEKEPRWYVHYQSEWPRFEMAFKDIIVDARDFQMLEHLRKLLADRVYAERFYRDGR